MTDLKKTHSLLGQFLEEFFDKEFQANYHFKAQNSEELRYENTLEALSSEGQFQILSTQSERLLIHVERSVLYSLSRVFLGCKDSELQVDENNLSLFESFMGDDLIKTISRFFKTTDLELIQEKVVSSLKEVRIFEEEETVNYLSLSVYENNIGVGNIHFCYPLELSGRMSHD